MRKSDADKIARALAGATRILITAHRDPDGDSIGCQLAFHEYWTTQRKGTADVVNHGSLSRKYRFLDPGGIIRSPGQVKRPRGWDAAIIFECSGLDRVGSVQTLLTPDLPLINIDHHGFNTQFGTVNVLDPTAAACGEMIFDLLRLWKARFTPTIAQQLAVAIVTDTGRFHYRSTTPRTLEMAASLMRLGANITALTDEIYFSYHPSHFLLIQHVLGNAQMKAGGKVCLLTLRNADRRRFRVPTTELEGLVDFALYISGVKIGALLKELGPCRTKVSLRSTDSSDVAAIARCFGGGGHVNASGCLIELPISEAVTALAKAIGPLRSHRKTTDAK